MSIGDFEIMSSGTGPKVGALVQETVDATASWSVAEWNALTKRMDGQSPPAFLKKIDAEIDFLKGELKRANIGAENRIAAALDKEREKLAQRFLRTPDAAISCKLAAAIVRYIPTEPLPLTAADLAWAQRVAARYLAESDGHPAT